jgi:hypothetical protein
MEATVDQDERERLIAVYAGGAARLRAAFEAVPEAARKWRPSDDEFSVHEVICHCADSETNAHSRIRYLLTDPAPVIVGYDPMRWSRDFAYQDHPVGAAMATIEAVRANTVPLLRRLDDDAWAAAGHHTEQGRYTAEDWLQTYAAHVEEHVEQIERTAAAWRAAH